MTSDRASAYKRVIRTLDDIGPTKLFADEQERVRHAADMLLFSQDAHDPEAYEAFADVERLTETLIENDRFEPVTASRLLDDLAACGPVAVPDVQAA